MGENHEPFKAYPFWFLLTMEVRLVDEAAGTALELPLTHPLDLVVLWTKPPLAMVCAWNPGAHRGRPC
jgi:hypothetical protein